MRSNEKGGTPREARSTMAQPWSRHSARLRRGLLALVVSGISITACRGAEQVASPPAPPVPPALTPPPDNSEIDEADIPGAVSIAPTLISTATYDGSGELV